MTNTTIKTTEAAKHAEPYIKEMEVLVKERDSARFCERMWRFAACFFLGWCIVATYAACTPTP